VIETTKREQRERTKEERATKVSSLFSRFPHLFGLRTDERAYILASKVVISAAGKTWEKSGVGGLKAEGFFGRRCFPSLPAVLLLP